MCMFATSTSPAATRIYTLSLHDALPISKFGAQPAMPRRKEVLRLMRRHRHGAEAAAFTRRRKARSEEHTSELQSQSKLVCRLLLEKKNMIAGLPVTGVHDNYARGGGVVR